MFVKTQYWFYIFLLNTSHFNSYRLIPQSPQSFFPFQASDLCRLDEQTGSHHGQINEGILQYHKFMERFNIANIFHEEESTSASPYFLEMNDQNHNIFTHNYYQLMGKIDEFLDPLEKIIGKKIVMLLSSFLPKVDQIGHKILHANNLFISKILNECSLSDEMKAKIILSVIEISQKGDNMGSFFLENYRRIVDWALNSANHI